MNPAGSYLGTGENHLHLLPVAIRVDLAADKVAQVARDLLEELGAGRDGVRVKVLADLAALLLELLARKARREPAQALLVDLGARRHTYSMSTQMHTHASR